MESLGVSEMAEPLDDVNQTVLDAISSKIDDIHRISQAIKSLRWKPQSNSSAENDAFSSAVDFSKCSCGDADCIEVCDIREWLPTTRLDDELWTLVLSLGETYMALGRCYLDDNQFHQALQIVELASTLVYGSMPQDTQRGDGIEVGSSPTGTCLTSECFLSTYAFWAIAWTLVGDTYACFNVENVHEKKLPIMKLKMLKGDKQRQSWHEGSLCYLMNCSCLVDRANSGAYASTSSRSTSGKDRNTKGHGRRGRNTGMEGNSEPVISEENNKTRPRTGDIFKFLSGLPSNGGDSEYNLSATLLCYEEAKKALGEYPDRSSQMESLKKRTGWAFNELGLNRLENQELEKSETAFQDAITYFRQVSDHTNITLIYSNLGYIRLSLAEKLAPLEALACNCKNTLFCAVHIQALKSAKHEYLESLKYCVAAKMEVAAIVDGDEAEASATNSLRLRVCTELAHVYLRFGMLLAKQDTKAEVDVNFCLADKTLGKKEAGKHEVSAKDVITEAISLFESMGELRKEHAAYGYKELAKYYRNCCLKFLGSQTKETMSKSKNSILKKVKKYVSLAEKNWQTSVDIYRADTHPLMHLTILLEMAVFSSSLSDQLHSNGVLDKAFKLLVGAFSILLEARHISAGELIDQKDMEDAFICDKFWSRLRLVSKNMLSMVSKSSSSSLQQILSRHPSINTNMLRNLYLMTLKSTEFAQLGDIHQLWIS